MVSITNIFEQGCLEDGELLNLLNASPGAEDEKEEEEEVQIDNYDDKLLTMHNDTLVLELEVRVKRNPFAFLRYIFLLQDDDAA